MTADFARLAVTSFSLDGGSLGERKRRENRPASDWEVLGCTQA